MNPDGILFKVLRSLYRAVNARLYRRITSLQSELDAVSKLAESANNDALWACEEARQLRDLMDAQYPYR